MFPKSAINLCFGDASVYRIFAVVVLDGYSDGLLYDIINTTMATTNASSNIHALEKLAE